MRRPHGRPSAGVAYGGHTAPKSGKRVRPPPLAPSHVRSSVHCDHAACELDGAVGLIKEDEDRPGERSVLMRCEAHALEMENMVNAIRYIVGVTARPTLRRVSIEEAAVLQVMGA